MIEQMKAYNESARRKLAGFTGRQQAAAAAPTQTQAGPGIQANQAEDLDPVDMLAEEQMDHAAAEHINRVVPGFGTLLEALKMLSEAQTAQPTVAPQQAAD